MFVHVAVGLPLPPRPRPQAVGALYDGHYSLDVFAARVQRIIRAHKPAKPLFLYVRHEWFVRVPTSGW